MNKQYPRVLTEAEKNLHWYKQFWPWFIIALPASVVIASFVTLWIAISNPDHLVVDEDEYRQLKSELKAQNPVQKDNNDKAVTPESTPDR